MCFIAHRLFLSGEHLVKFRHHRYCLRLTPKKVRSVYIYISLQFYSGILKTFRSFIGAFHVFLRKHVPEKLIVAQSVLVSTYPLLRSLCFDKTHGIVATQKSS